MRFSSCFACQSSPCRGSGGKGVGVRLEGGKSELLESCDARTGTCARGS